MLGPMKRTLLASLIILAGCSSKKEEPKVLLGACHKTDVVEPCRGAAPGRLTDKELEAGFLVDAHVEAGLAGIHGRRVTFGDVNGDRWPDIFAVRTGVTPGLQQLLLNQNGVYVVATTNSGILASRAGATQTALMGTFGDVDNDGDLDLFSGSYSQDPVGGEGYVADPNEIYLNDGTGTFSLKLDSGIHVRWPLTTAAAVFFDYDKDGNLDLFVGTFMKDYPYLNSYQDDLYRGNGDGTFTLVNDEAGITTSGSVGDEDGMYTKPTYGATACDVDDDGWQDVLVSVYALGWDDLWRNRRNGTFENVAS